ncbi:hypothetical protein JHL18_21535 [Clostridium sp. YIM B02505]|uniref:Uncharacterized protein n=1 Tax=Clostridium yunnanense TaxID=2800325 RepID=A0ABS1EV53_9CLOT|nr:hypothetical protein [Clostridium yunnanense]MBK1813209.1 hypothetical protein [Clostridium yunnanense]
MKDKFTKFMLAGILLCLIVIADKPTSNQNGTFNPATVNVNTGQQVIQLAPNRIAVVDNSSNSGMEGTILVFDYDSNTKKFNYSGTMNYYDYFRNPSKYGVFKN